MFSKILFFLLFVLIYFAVRKPDYDIPLYGEDGIFADIFINSPPRPNYGQNARIHGKTIYSRLGHPSPLYEWISISGKFFTNILPLKKAADDNNSDLPTYLRFSFSCFQLLAWILLLVFLMTRPREKSKWSDLFLLLLLANSPPAITYSLWLQVDNASGSIIMGILMSAILIWDRYNTMSFTKTASLLFGAGFVSAMGKNEWSILIFLSIIATASFIFYKKIKNINDTKKEFFSLFSLLMGLITGNLFSYLFNSTDYMGGLELMTNMSQQSSLLNSSQIERWWALTKIRLPVLYLSLALWLYVTFVFLRKSFLNISITVVLSFFLASAFLWSFFITSWDPVDRYFIPAFIALVFTVMLIRTNYRLEIDKYVYFIFLFLGLDSLHNYSVSLNNHQYRVDHIEQFRKSIPTKQGCIHHITYYAFNLKNIDYVGMGNGAGNLEGHMKASGLKVCE